MCRLQENSEFKQITGRLNHDTSIVILTSGISAFSFLAEALTEEGSPTNFENQLYKLEVSHDAFDNPPENGDNADDYYNVMLNADNEKWLHLWDISLGTATSIDNSWNETNMGTRACPVHFRYCRLSTPAIPNVKVRLTISSR